MIDYKDLPVGPIETNAIKTFEKIFSACVKSQDDLGKSFRIDERFWPIWNTSQEQIQHHFAKHGYSIRCTKEGILGRVCIKFDVFRQFSFSQESLWR